MWEFFLSRTSRKKEERAERCKVVVVFIFFFGRLLGLMCCLNGLHGTS